VLPEWLRYQRSERGRAFQCSYQRLRLECVPQFEWDPLDVQWDEQLADYVSFVATHSRVPRYRSQNPQERSLAAWAVKQRQLIRTGRAPGHRITEFERATGQ